MDLWEYNEALKICVLPLTRANGALTITLLSRLLTAALSASNLIREDDGRTDFSHIRADDLRAPDDAPTSFEGLLARTLARVTIEVARADEAEAEKTIALIEKRSWTIFRLIALHALAETGTRALSLARARMLDKRLFDEASQQYAQLLRARLGQLTHDEQEVIVAWIMQGPDLETRAANYQEFYGRPPSAPELEVAQKVWTRDRLLWLGDNIPLDKRRLLDELIAAVGEPQREPMVGISWWGPASPKSDDDFNSMSIHELLEFLKSWKPAETSERKASRIGLAKQLQTASKGNPTRFAQAAETFIGLEPTYVHHLIWGLEEALRTGAAFDWAPVLALCGWMVQQSRGEEPDIPFPLRDHEESWAGARRATARLVDIGLQRNLITENLRKGIWDIIQALAEDPEPTLKDEDARGANADPTATSLNTVRGQAMHAAIKYASWMREIWDQRDTERKRTFNDLPEVRELLDRRLNPLFEATATIWSMYGQYFPLLTYMDRNWAADNIPKIFQQSEPRLWSAAWKAYMQFGGTYDDVFRLLRPQYALAVQNLSEYPSNNEGDSAVEHLGSHLMVFYWRDLVTLKKDDLLIQFLSNASPTFRKRSLEFVGRSLVNTKDEVPPEVLKRLVDLWESRVRLAHNTDDRQGFSAELSSFGTWFLSSKFDDRWAIEQLLELFGLIEIDALNAYPVIKRLAEISTKMPGETVRCLEGLLLGARRNWLYVSGMAEVRTILQSAIDNGDWVTRRIAVRIIERLAERGDMTYRHLVPGDL
jgi:hypothetical protein